MGINLTNKIPFLDVYGDVNLVCHVIKSRNSRRASTILQYQKCNDIHSQWSWTLYLSTVCSSNNLKSAWSKLQAFTLLSATQTKLSIPLFWQYLLTLLSDFLLIHMSRKLALSTFRKSNFSRLRKYLHKIEKIIVIF